MLASALLTEDPRTDVPSASHLLIAVDDTPAGRRTLAAGLAQAAAQDAEATVVHVVPARRFRVTRMGPLHAIPIRLRDPLGSPILREALRLAVDHGIRPHLELIAADDVDAAIVGLARHLGAATIVVGASRPEHLAGPLGVCRGVLRRAPVPVFVVPS